MIVEQFKMADNKCIVCANIFLVLRKILYGILNKFAVA
jgi:hypothetical protein